MVRIANKCPGKVVESFGTFIDRETQRGLQLNAEESLYKVRRSLMEVGNILRNVFRVDDTHSMRNVFEECQRCRGSIFQEIRDLDVSIAQVSADEAARRLEEQKAAAKVREDDAAKKLVDDSQGVDQKSASARNKSTLMGNILGYYLILVIGLSILALIVLFLRLVWEDLGKTTPNVYLRGAKMFALFLVARPPRKG